MGVKLLGYNAHRAKRNLAMTNQIKIVNILIGIFNGVADGGCKGAPPITVDNDKVMDNIIVSLQKYIQKNPVAPTDDKGFIAFRLAPELLETVQALKGRDTKKVHECARVLQIRMAGSSVISEALRNDLLEARRVSRAELNPVNAIEAM
jgi:hypothetical protein